MKTYDLMPARVAELSETIHQGIMYEIQNLGYGVKPGLRLCVIGAGEGNIARFAAWCFESSELHLVDNQKAPDDFDPVCSETFHQLDVLTSEFVEQLRGKVDVILCFMVTHELGNPGLGITNILRVLPKQPGCFAWFLDLSAYQSLQTE